MRKKRGWAAYRHPIPKEHKTYIGYKKQMQKQVPLYSWTQRTLPLAKRLLSLELSTVNNRLLCNDGTSSDTITLKLSSELVNGRFIATHHSDDLDFFATIEHATHICDVASVPSTYVQRCEVLADINMLHILVTLLVSHPLTFNEVRLLQ